MRGVNKLKEIVRALHEEEELKSILSGLDMGKSPAVVSGLSPVHRAHLMALIMESTGLPVCAVCSDDSEARRFAGDIAGFTGKTPVLITERDFVFYNVEGVSRQGEHSRITALYKLLNGENPVVATVEGICQRTMPPEDGNCKRLYLHYKEDSNLAPVTPINMTSCYFMFAGVLI